MYEVVMPKLGLTMDSGTLLRWYVEEGSQVEKDQPLFEVQTDKVAQEVTAPVAGTLRGISLQPEEEALIGIVIAYIVAPGETFTPPVDAGKPVAAPAASVAEVTATSAPAAPAPARDGGRIKVSPAARRAAREHGVDLAQVRGSGPGGRIKTEDVLAVVEAQQAQPPAGAAAPAAEEELVTPPQMHQVMARRMSESFRDVPHFYLTVEVEARRLVELRSGLIAAIEEQTGIRLTLSDLLVKIAALTLARHPKLNTSWVDGKLRRHPAVHLGVAIAVEQGLLVPVIRQADAKSLVEIVRQRKAMVDKAQAGRLTLDDITGGTFTLSNLGMFGIDLFQAIVNPPEGAILAVGTVRERPVVEDGLVVARPTFFMTLSMDHRVTDGAHAARFLQDLKDALEAPYAVLLPG